MKKGKYKQILKSCFLVTSMGIILLFTHRDVQGNNVWIFIIIGEKKFLQLIFIVLLENDAIFSNFHFVVNEQAVVSNQGQRHCMV